MTDYGHPRLVDFSLSTDKTHLNHGSFGAVPKILAQEQENWRQKIEANPTGFFRQSVIQDHLRAGAERLAQAYGGRGGDWVFVDNATSGANAAISALKLKAGDRVLATSEIYNAVRQALTHNGGRGSVALEELVLPLPLESSDQVLSILEDALRQDCAAVFVDHVTSRSALVLPVIEIGALCRSKSVPLFVDGAHAPGMVEIDVEAIGADWYTGNGHKWLCAPRGCGFLWTTPQRQDATHPVVISHGYGTGYCNEFDWVGTRDPSAWLSLGAALEWHEAMGGESLRARNHELAVAMAELMANRLDCQSAGPPALMGSMAAVRLPGPASADAAARCGRLDNEADVVVSLHTIEGADWLRLSAAIYNELEDCQALLSGLEKGL